MVRSLSVIALALACATGCASIGSRQTSKDAAYDNAVVADDSQQSSDVMQAAYCSDCGCGDGSCGCADDIGGSNCNCSYPGAACNGYCRPGHNLGAHGPGMLGPCQHDNIYNFNPGPPVGQTAYPYYTVRGPRDFLQSNPQPLGPF
jgi:hypothetical protein